ncbi:cryptochrome-1-like isoform X1 [Daphnia pulicaria]|uniref:cryptochrome-1-like isoform X1 n=2 Tax=Daphnia pulicaria TaxID=35523 RepID=UPI001EEBC34B|nr:cryptochrome-1-like isoform X1 [Daphnia pulicaria]XP_046642555.1 cryptochrome-1-like isoform X1 [Daphnia pulicaria]
MNVLWFRRGLRIHDNPALLSALENSKDFIALFVFDTTFQDPGYKPYHMNGFLLECLQDLNESLKSVGTKLHVFQGCPLEVFRHLHNIKPINKLCFIQDCEPIFHERDIAAKNFCSELDIEVYEHVAHTLWDPMDIIASNGGTPPLTYEMFVHVAMSVGDPPKPVADPEWKGVKFLTLEPFESNRFTLFGGVPTLSQIGVPENPVGCRGRRIFGGETNALKHFAIRLQAEETAFRSGFYQPNQARPDLLGPPLSLSAAISVGAISVRLFYWKIHEIFDKVNRGNPPAWLGITGQIIWRDYFYAMSRMNPKFDKEVDNPICLQIPWVENEEFFEKWKNGQTGYPFIDAGMRQLNQEGWMHHSVRNAVAMFLTRGDLWLNWDIGAEYMANQLVDSDWSVNSGNWMWVSSSAFERLLDCSVCINSVLYGKRLEPSGDYIRRYVPELANFEFEYIHEPWKAPINIQRTANCIIGQDYPARIVVHEEVLPRNLEWMKEFRQKFKETPAHCQPSSNSEVYKFFCLPDDSLPF